MGFFFVVSGFGRKVSQSYAYVHNHYTTRARTFQAFFENFMKKFFVLTLVKGLNKY